MLQRYGNGKRLDTTLSKCDELEYKLYHKHYNKDGNECITLAYAATLAWIRESEYPYVRYFKNALHAEKRAREKHQHITNDDVLQLKEDDIYLYPYECIIDYLPLFSDRKLRALTNRAKQKLKSFEWNYKGIKDYYKQARYKYYYR